MNREPKVSILMCVYNKEQYIEETIKSVLSQSDPSWELLIRDNGSTDCTGEICEKFADEDGRIQVVHNKVNMVTDEGYHVEDIEFWPVANAEYITLLDGDDLLHPDFVRILYRRAKETGADIVMAGHKKFWNSEPYNTSSLLDREVPELFIDNSQDFAAYFPMIHYSIGMYYAKLTRTEHWNKWYSYSLLHYSNHRFMNFDWYLGFGMASKAKKIATVSVDLLYNRRYLNSTSQMAYSKDEFLKEYSPRGSYDCERRCLEAWNSLTPENEKFILWRTGSVLISKLRLAIPGGKEKLSERIDYIKLAATYPDAPDQSDPCFIHGSWKKYREAFQSALLAYDKECRQLENWSDWLLRLYSTLSMEETDPQQNYLKTLAMYSSIFDEENINRFGSGELENYTGQTAAGRKLLTYAKRSGYPAGILRNKEITLKLLGGAMCHEVDKKCDNLESLMRQKNAETGRLILSELNEYAPLNPVTIYYQADSCLKNGEKETAYKISVCGHSLYPEDERIEELCIGLSKAFKL